MPRKPQKGAQKTEVVAFKVEEKLAQLLNQLPNKSAFIRKAIAAQLGMACPLCNGLGVVPRGIHDHFADQLAKINHRPCDGCGDDMAVPRDDGDLARDDRERLEQFFHGGPLYCDGCYEKAPSARAVAGTSTRNTWPTTSWKPTTTIDSARNLMARPGFNCYPT